MPTSSTNIRRVEEEYTRDEAEWSRTKQVDIYLTVDIDMLEAYITPSTLTDDPSGTSSSSAPTTFGPTASAVAASHPVYGLRNKVRTLTGKKRTKQAEEKKKCEPEDSQEHSVCRRVAHQTP
uniref:Integrase core domain containing protein n=1 Tax=Solanum tuberosum TaxID=4113 RepID=M1DTZ5_SOLTU